MSRGNDRWKALNDDINLIRATFSYQNQNLHIEDYKAKGVHFLSCKSIQNNIYARTASIQRR